MHQYRVVPWVKIDVLKQYAATSLIIPPSCHHGTVSEHMNDQALCVYRNEMKMMVEGSSEPKKEGEEGRR